MSDEERDPSMDDAPAQDDERASSSSQVVAPSGGGLRGWWSRRGRWFRRIAIVIIVLLILQPIVGFFGVPLLIRKVIVPRIGTYLDGTIALRDAQFNPYTWRMGLDGLVVTDPEGHEAIRLARAELDFNPLSSLFLPGWRFNDIVLMQPEVSAIVAARMGLNLARIPRPGEPPDPAEPRREFRVPRFIVGSLEIREGTAELNDQTFAEPLRVRVGGVTFRVENLDTTPRAENIHSFDAVTETGARIEWKGTLSLDPPLSKGTLVLTDLALPEFAAYATRFTDASITGGQLSAVVAYHFAPIPPQPDPSNAAPSGAPSNAEPIVRATVHLAEIRDLKTSREQQPLAEVPLLLLRRADLDLLARSIVVENIALEGGSLLVDRDEQGAVNFARMIRARPADSTSATQAAGDPRKRVDLATLPDPAQQLLTSVSYLIEDLRGAWSLGVQSLQVTNQSIDFEDRSTPEPVRAALRAINLEAGPVTTDEAFVVPYTVSATINDAPASATGSFSVLRRTLDTDAATEGLGLAAFGPYIRLIDAEPFASTRVVNGRLTAKGHAKLATPDIDRMSGDWSGDLRLEQLRTEQIETATSVISAESIDITGDAQLVVSRTDGIDAKWTGTLRGLGGDAGPSLLDACGLGPGSITMQELDIDGDVMLDQPIAGDARGSWAGKLQFREVNGRDLAAREGSAISGAFALLALDATADLRIGFHGGADARWKGAIELTTGSADATGDAPIAATLGQFGVTGEGTIGVSPDRAITLGWEGQSALAELAATLAASGVEVVASSASLHGVVDFTRSQDHPMKLGWQGNAALGSARLEHGSGEDRIELVEQSTEFDGALQVRAATDGALAVELDAKLAIQIPELRSHGEGGVAATAEQITLSGSAEGSLTDEFKQASWNATVMLSRYALANTEGLADQPSLTGGSLAVAGDGTASYSASRQRLEWKGKATAERAEAIAPRVSGSVTATVEHATADGALTAQQEGGQTSFSWKGSESARGIASTIGDLGGPAQVTIQDITSTSEISGSLAGEDLALRWAGALAANKGGADALDSLRASAAALGMRGELAFERNESGVAALQWNGGANIDQALIRRGAGTGLLDAGGDSATFEGSFEAHPSATGSGVVAKGLLTIDGARAGIGEPKRLSAEARSIVLTDVGFDDAKMLVSAERLAISGVALEGELDSPTAGATPAQPAEAPSVPPAAPTHEQRRAALAFADQLPWTLHLRELRVDDTTLRLIGTVDTAVGSERLPLVLDEIVIDAHNISTDGTNTDAEGGSIDLSARLAGSGRVTAKGSVDPFRSPPVADLTISIDNAPIPPTNPVSSRYLGWIVTAGRLNTTIPFSITGGTVNGTLNFMLDSVELGGRSKSPDAPDLPLDFALAIMKDSKGQVKGSIPFSGDATSPDFSIGGLIVDVILNFIGKIATAPFQLIASAIEGSGDADLSSLAFEPGSATLGRDGVKVVDLLSKALQERPGLSVTVEGQYSIERDERSLRLALLREQVAERGRKAFPPRKTIDDRAYRSFVEDLWKESPEGQAARKAKQTVSFEGMEQALLERVPFQEAMLTDLARRRADAVVAAFAGGGIAADRVHATLAGPDTINAARPQVAIELGLSGSAPAPDTSGP